MFVSSIMGGLVLLLVVVLMLMILKEKQVFPKIQRLFKKPSGRHRAAPLPIRHRAQPERRPVRRSNFIFV